MAKKEQTFRRYNLDLKIEVAGESKTVYQLMQKLGIRSVIRKKRRFFGKQTSVMYNNRLE